MSGEALKSAAVMAANQDTPANVNVPNSWAGVISWLVGRVGAPAAMAIIFAVYMGSDRNKVYDQNQLLNTKILEAFTARTVIETQHVSLLQTIQVTLVKIDEKLEREKEKRNMTP